MTTHTISRTDLLQVLDDPRSRQECVDPTQGV